MNEFVTCNEKLGSFVLKWYCITANIERNSAGEGSEGKFGEVAGAGGEGMDITVEQKVDLMELLGEKNNSIYFTSTGGIGRDNAATVVDYSSGIY